MRGPGMKCWIPATARDLLVEDGDKWHPLETGGVLVGYWAGPEECVISELSQAGVRAVHERYRFVPDYDADGEFCERRFQNSDGVMRYLGDWHTHPNQSWPRMSFKDKRTLLRISKSKEARQPNPLMVICGGSPAARQIRCWTTQRRRALGIEIKRETECQVEFFKK